MICDLMLAKAMWQLSFHTCRDALIMGPELRTNSASFFWCWDKEAFLYPSPIARLQSIIEIVVESIGCDEHLVWKLAAPDPEYPHHVKVDVFVSADDIEEPVLPFGLFRPMVTA